LNETHACVFIVWLRIVCLNKSCGGSKSWPWGLWLWSL